MDIQKLKEGARNYLKKHYEPEVCAFSQIRVSKEVEPKLICSEEDLRPCEPFILYQTAYPKSEPNEKELISDIINDLDYSFSETLFRLIKAKDMTETECYQRANIDRRLFSKIRSNDDYRPKKETVFAFIVSLKLTLEEAQDLMDKAGYSISHSIKFDVIMEYLIKKRVYDINQVNEVLDSFECPLLGAKM